MVNIHNWIAQLDKNCFESKKVFNFQKYIGQVKFTLFNYSENIFGWYHNITFYY